LQSLATMQKFEIKKKKKKKNCLNKQGKKVDFDHEIMNHEKGSIQLCVGFFLVTVN
jgi:hypothetical protein